MGDVFACVGFDVTPPGDLACAHHGKHALRTGPV